MAPASPSPPQPDGGPLVALTGMRVLRVAASRVALAYCLSVVVTVPVVLLPSRPGLALLLTTAALAPAVALGVELRRPPGVRPVCLVALAYLTSTALLPALTPFVGARNEQLLIGFIGNGLVIGVAAAWGPRLGVAMTVWGLLCWAGGVLAWGGAPNLLMMFETGTAAAIGLLAGVAIPRGFGTTQAALVAAEDAEAARQVAAARWSGQRRQIRDLHDTVLSTLSVLADGGAGVGDEALRRECAEHAVHLRDSVVPSPGEVRGALAAHVAGADVRDDAATAIADLLHRWAERGLTVDCHGDDARDAVTGLARETVRDTVAALDQCLSNVWRHSGVTSCTLTLSRSDGRLCCTVIDEGRGFDADDVDDEGARLGLAESVLGRIQDVGGTVRIWSRAGAGTSVALEVPCTAPERV